MKLLEKYKYIILFTIVIIAGILRFYKITDIPPGLYMDEAANAVDAYSIKTTGRDQYGAFMPLWFKSFVDYKMPLYIYAMSGSMFLFGKTDLAVRFPAALSGTLTVIIMYFLVFTLVRIQKKTPPDKSATYLALISSFLLAISPWHIQFSRGGFEVMLATSLYLLALLVGLYFYITKKNYLLFLSFIIFSLSIYTYHTYRIIAPLTMIGIAGFIYIHNKRFVIPLFALLVAFIMVLPLIRFSLTPEGLTRFSQTSAFEEYRAEKTYEKILIYPLVYIKNYISFLSFDYLFTFGDGIGRHQIHEFGGIFRWQIPFIIIGGFALLRSKKSIFFYMILLLLLITPLPAAIARPSPHTLRGLLLVIPWTIIAAYGLYKTFYIKRKNIVLPLLLLVALYEMFFYLHFYYIHYKSVNIMDWGGGYKQLFMRLNELAPSYKHIIIDSKITYAYTYYSFYGENYSIEIKDMKWSELETLRSKGILYVSPYYGETDSSDLIENIHLSNNNNDIFAQLWKL